MSVVAQRFLRSAALIAVIALPAAGCQTAGGGGLLGASAAPPSTTAEARGNDWQREAAAAGERYRADPGSAQAALRYAQALRRTGQRAQATAVLQQASIRHSRDRTILGAYGRALAEAGQLTEALDMLSRAHTPDQPDWRILSAQGAVLDQMGRHEEARRYYTTALKIVPGEASVLSNLGLSYALEKRLPQAEENLRLAAAGGATDRRVRQNLALVIGLQGRFKEAEEIARADLPPDQAAENVAYLQDMIARQQVAAAMPKGKAKTNTKLAKKPVNVAPDAIPLQQAELSDKD